jgi:hypothetical protein
MLDNDRYYDALSKNTGCRGDFANYPFTNGVKLCCKR